MRIQHGFSLLEMAIVIALMGLIAGAGLSMASALRINNGIAATRTKQEAIKEALITFIARHRRLPCPAVETLPPGVGYGVESGAPGACGATALAGGVQRGVVPWVSLGLPDADALDGWNNRFSYFVVEAATRVTDNALIPLSGMRGGIALHSGTPVALGLAATGLPNNQLNACSTTPGDNGCNIAAVAVILSHGMNGSSAFMPSGMRRDPPVGTALLELANADPPPNVPDASFVQAQYSDNPDNPFDDLLLAMTPADLLGPLERNGSFQAALSITNERMAAIRDRVNLDIVDNNGIIPATPPSPPNDGWGPPIAFAYNTPTVGPGTNVCALVGTPTLIFTLTSGGLDPSSVGDDIAVTQDDVKIRTMINNKSVPCP